MNLGIALAPLRVVIVDDEAPAREHLAALLAPHPHVTIAGEAADVETAAELCARVSPNIVFLDVQLHGATGFELLPRLTGSPALIFVAASGDYAVQAFEVKALDYLLKPVTPERLARALARAASAAIRAAL